MTERVRLGVNIDHVATLRNARGGAYPDTLRAARAAAKAGADGITIHLREDRRHIRDDDVERLIGSLEIPVNLEMAATREMQAIALRFRPRAVCLVPEKRRELTTEGGLDVAAGSKLLRSFVAPLTDAGIRVSLFIDPDRAQVEAARDAGAPAVELHTGAYCDADARGRGRELARLEDAARHGAGLGLEIHAGHGLTFETAGAVAAITEIAELNIGHFLVSEAIFIGLEAAVRRMRACMDEGRAGAVRIRRA
ncbi:MAG: pyridoxine 5'-phosphate synthase [Alphaproteobacteria bacterium]